MTPIRYVALPAAFALLSACTMIKKNPPEEMEPVAAQADDSVQTTAAAPVAAPESTDDATEQAKEAANRLSSSLRFDTGSAKLKPEAVSGLKELAEIISKEESIKVSVDAYTDSTGSDPLNEKLSQKRANAVSKVLSQNGVPASRIDAEGHAKGNPIADNDTAQGRAKNRRAQLKID